MLCNKIKNFLANCDKAIFLKKIKNIENVLSKAFQLESKYLDDENSLFHIYYAIANLYFEKAKILNEYEGTWRDGSFPINSINALNYYRKANKLANNIPLSNKLYLQTNYANCLSLFYRVIEANNLLSFNYGSNYIFDYSYIAPFCMSKNLLWLKEYINDNGHAQYYTFEAYKHVKGLYFTKDLIPIDGIKNELENSNWVKKLIKWGNDKEKLFKSYKDLSFNIKYKSKDELLYRSWCLKNKFFLNPLNDITKEYVAANDILQFPNYVVNINEGPYYSAAFSDIKNRFVKARYIFFSSICKKYPKWLEKGLYLTDTLDYVDYSTNSEYLKIAIRLCFSILDNLTVLIKHYFELNTKKPSFTSNWIKNNCRDINNPFIDALYWLACDLTDISSEKNWQAPNPEAKDIRELRNNLEHNWVRVAENNNSIWNKNHDYAQIIDYDSLEDSAYKIFKYVRNAILYFTYSIKFNEKEKEKKIQGLIPQIEVFTYSDYHIRK